ncbi:1-aminocyclopropane-1-carboxylate deaminase [Actinorhabdospora filicis]|uniref:1-aminocyclopropane-1-carboxylate deaminase n=1 Tax=Actinorhabdospora filicis TaxID=1785913 RepID=A0A9W6WAJ3_9ACTN|nr:pyridoxal-phosphate dependent enzyme [Actinorhabdospora filicis]GLZ79714.1 1-aminocyclopropane-1-carboxylate deaminase [Actinorhabdospora filicis]
MTPALPSPLHDIGGGVLLKRDDLIHPLLPGNKWRKLHLNLAAAEAAGASALLTFGGAYSNHLRAVAAAGRARGLRTVGVVRGEEHAPLNPSLAFCAAQGMELSYLDRASYRRKDDPEVLAALLDRHGPAFVVPEGGANADGARGCVPIAAEIDVPYDLLVCPVGTGTTLAGLAHGTTAEVAGVCVLKGAQYLDERIALLQRETFGETGGNWRVDHRFHHGGFAKTPAELADFAADFAAEHGWRPEPVYVAKALYAVLRGGLGAGRRVVVLVTGLAPSTERSTVSGVSRPNHC